MSTEPVEDYIRRHDLPEYEHLGIREGDVVLDVGGHVGLFAEFAYAREANRVLSFEPEPKNAAAHLANLARFRGQHLLVQAAVVDDATTLFVPLFVNKGINTGRHTVLPELTKGGFYTIQVPCVAWAGALAMAQFTVVKIDVEGAEYSYDFRLIPPSVRAVAIEFHDLPKREKDRASALDQLRLRGFAVVYQSEEAPAAVSVLRR